MDAGTTERRPVSAVSILTYPVMKFTLAHVMTRFWKIMTSAAGLTALVASALFADTSRRCPDTPMPARLTFLCHR